MVFEFDIFMLNNTFSVVTCEGKMKNKNIFKKLTFKIFGSFMLCFALLLASVAMTMPAKETFASISPSGSDIERPESLEEGLSRKSLEEVRGKRVTIRQPQMEVLQRNIKRTAPKVMGDTFNLPNFETREETGASITFTKYPSLSNKEKFTSFEKYMLLREVFYYNKYAMEDAEAGTLMKHPAADGQYGVLEVEDNAVKKRILTDPNYRSPMTTGLYLAPGEVAEVVVEGLKEGESVTLYTHHQQTVGYAVGDVNAYFKKYDELIIAESQKSNPNYEGLEIELNGQYDRQINEIPAMGATFVLTENKTYHIGCPFGGPLYVQPTSSPVQLTITGAVETPHFILGVTTVEDFETNLRQAPGLIATLDCENGQLIGPSQYMRNADDIEKLAYFWHSAFAVNASFNGRAYNYDITLSFDTHVPAGSAVALSATRAAHPSGWFGTCMNYQALTTSGLWGVFHELGHVHANAYGSIWGMKESKEGEVRNNTLIVIIYTMLGNMDSRVIGVEHGEFTHPYTTVQRSLNLSSNSISDYSDCDYFDMLSVYSNLIHYFSPESFVDFLYTYNIEKTYCDNARADFAYRIALTDGMNIVDWLNRCYMTNITDSMFSAEQLEFLNSLPDFYPIAYRYANGVNDTETARKHDVDFNSPTEFDFSGDNILSPAPFEIVSYRKPIYGKIDVSEDMTKVTYTPPKGKIVENDEFAVRVRIKWTGVDVYLPVRLNFAFNNSVSKVWDGIGTRDIDAGIAEVEGTDPTYTEVSATPGKKQYTADSKTQSYINTKFQYVATESGTHKFYTRSDDSSRVIFTHNGEEKGRLTIIGDRSSYNTSQFVEIELQAGEVVEIETHHINYGGKCYLYVGVMKPNSETISDISQNNMLHPDFDIANISQLKDFGWKPKFFVSVKNAYNNNPASKEGWEILSAPAPQDTTYEMEENMVDKDDSTIFHSRWYGAGIDPMPHTIVLDTKSVQRFNYFEIVTRNNVNSFIRQMELYGAEENEDDKYSLLYSTDNLKYDGLRATITFTEKQVRYFKIVVKSTSGGHFTVIAELNAGLTTKMEQPIKPSTFASDTTGFDEDNNGELVSKSQGSVFEFDFVGTGFDVFANMGQDYGEAKVLIDGKEKGTIDLSGEFAINKLVFSVTDLAETSHHVRIETLSDSVFHIAYLNVKYGVDTGEEVEPEKPKFSQKDELYVNGHEFGEEVVKEPAPKPNIPQADVIHRYEEKRGNTILPALSYVAVGFVVIGLVLAFVFIFKKKT